MRILHTSDWHIGRQLHHVSLLEDQRYVLEQIVDLCQSEKVDAVIVAGDVYDRAIPPAHAVTLVDSVFHTLCNELSIPVIVIAGNHDGPERLGFASRQLSKANLYISGPLTQHLNPVILKDDHGEVHFYPLPYADPATVRDVFIQSFDKNSDKDKDSNKDNNTEDNKVDTEQQDQLRSHDQCMAKILQQVPEVSSSNNQPRQVVISHCFIAGGSECDSERPLSVGGAEQVSAKHFERFNYTALGHLHRPQKVASAKSKQATIRYSGSILKYSFSEEKHKKSVTVVDLDKKGQCTIKEIALNSLRDMRKISGAIDDIIASAKKDPHSDDYVLISLTDTHAILDPMGKLREVYPNILHLERLGLMSQNTAKTTNRDVLKQSGLSMFKDFYKQVGNDELNHDQEKILVTLIDSLSKDES